MSFNFADSYKAAGLAPGPEIIRLRQEVFDKYRNKIDAPITIGLTRLYFGLPSPDGTAWFQGPFEEADPSFSMLDNEREAAVLSACLLAAALEDGKVPAGLAPLAAAAAGNRSPLVRPEFLEEARAALHRQAVEARFRERADISRITPLQTSKIPNAVTTFLQAPDWPKSGQLFTQVAEESLQTTQNLAGQIQTVLVPLLAEVADLREEIDILWWYVGGWSRLLDRPFVELEPALAAALAGLDLASLSRGRIGPAAAPAILQRLISGCPKPASGKVTIDDAVAAFPTALFTRLSLDDRLKRVPDICPVLSAFWKASEIGDSPAWHGAFRKTSQIDPTAAFHPLELAMQVYREALLLALLA